MSPSIASSRSTAILLVNAMIRFCEFRGQSAHRLGATGDVLGKKRQEAVGRWIVVLVVGAMNGHAALLVDAKDDSAAVVDTKRLTHRLRLVCPLAVIVLVASSKAAMVNLGPGVWNFPYFIQRRPDVRACEPACRHDAVDEDQSLEIE